MNQDILNKIRVNLPLRMADQYMDKYIELGISPEIGIDAEAMDNISFEKAGKIAEKFRAESRKITMHGPFFDLNIASSDPLISSISEKRILNSLFFVGIFKPESIVFHPGYDFRRNGYNLDQWMEKSIKFWTGMASMLNGMGVALHLENVYERSPEEILPIVESVSKEGGGFCFDTGHCNAFGDGDMCRWIDLLGKYTKEIHLHDNDGNNDLHLPPGKGNIDFSPLLTFLSENDASPIVTLEPHTEEDLYPSVEWLESNYVFQ